MLFKVKNIFTTFNNKILNTNKKLLLITPFPFLN